MGCSCPTRAVSTAHPVGRFLLFGSFPAAPVALVGNSSRLPCRCLCNEPHLCNLTTSFFIRPSFLRLPTSFVALRSTTPRPRQTLLRSPTRVRIQQDSTHRQRPGRPPTRPSTPPIVSRDGRLRHHHQQHSHEVDDTASQQHLVRFLPTDPVPAAAAPRRRRPHRRTTSAVQAAAYHCGAAHHGNKAGCPAVGELQCRGCAR